MEITDGNSGYTACEYDYLLPSGDFDIRIDLNSYDSENSIDGAKIHLYVWDAVFTPDNYAYVGYFRDIDHVVRARAMINTSEESLYTDIIAGVPTRLRMVRDGTTLKAYYYYSGWTLLDSWDFSSYASEIDIITIALESDCGGQVLMDNLKFVEGCPEP